MFVRYRKATCIVFILIMLKYFLLEIDVICYNIFTIQQILAFQEYKSSQHVLLLEVEKSLRYSCMISPINYLAQISSFIYHDHVFVWIAIPLPGTKSTLMFTSCVRIENCVICLASIRFITLRVYRGKVTHIYVGIVRHYLRWHAIMVK